jgi:hypothetical protein
MHEFLQLSFVFEAVTALALLVLLYIYLRNIKKIKCHFTIGLVVFAALLFLNSVGTLYTHSCMAAAYQSELVTYEMVTAVLKLAAIGALLYITWKGS